MYLASILQVMVQAQWSPPPKKKTQHKTTTFISSSETGYTNPTYFAGLITVRRNRQMQTVRVLVCSQHHNELSPAFCHLLGSTPLATFLSFCSLLQALSITLVYGGIIHGLFTKLVLKPSESLKDLTGDDLID